MKKNQPLIHVKPEKFDRRVDSITWFLLVALWILTIVFYTQLPERVPSHFNAKGVADYADSKATLFLLPVIATGLVIFLTILNRHPHKFNYLVRITDENAADQYRLAMRAIRVLKFGIVLLFSVIVIIIFLTTTERIHDPGQGTILSLLLLTQIPTFYFLYKSLKKG